MSRETVDVLGVQIDVLTMPQALKRAAQLAQDGRGHYIVTPNPEFIMQALGDGRFREVINRADLSLADGVGVLWAAKFLSIPISRFCGLAYLQAWVQMVLSGIGIILCPRSLTSVLPERITGVDMVWEISKLASERGFKVFLLGAAPGVAYEVSRKLQMLYPKLLVVDVMAGPPYEPEAEVIRRIKDIKPQFLFLAFPATEQLRWMRDYSHALPGVVMMGIGGAFDFIAEAGAINAPSGDATKARRAPRLLQKRGLEWLWRYFTQPWRKQRIKTATVDFIKIVFNYKLTRLSGGQAPR
ncbi:hypothetical protein A2V68_02880 [candidate division Kazan bacterium RBG_13_50_9]|uniref:Glycosyltransferase n=1 Tax=candidate division Kazan bacterium RBG_13_50_9 TaxID=1798535 RepID=A0A1F4NT56_UNCK3|nr:MAG: hypothetical protein A2V68_02880 [candidate division Kazan bacterium RBG_13_50_9]